MCQYAENGIPVQFSVLASEQKSNLRALKRRLCRFIRKQVKRYRKNGQ